MAAGASAATSAAVSLHDDPMQDLAANLRCLREQDILCDVAVTASGSQFPVHRAVLAAISLPLRNYFLAEKGGCPGCQGHPSVKCYSPLVLHWKGISQDEVIQRAIDYMYGAANCNQERWRKAQVCELQCIATAFCMPGLVAGTCSARSLVNGLQALRSRASFCDLELVVGSERYAAHSVVIAAASPSFLSHALTSPALHGEGNSSKLKAGTLQVDLDGISEPLAVEAMLDHMYCQDSLSQALSSASNATLFLKDLKLLAERFSLPVLEVRVDAALDELSGPAESAACSGIAETRFVAQSLQGNDPRKDSTKLVSAPGKQLQEERPASKRRADEFPFAPGSAPGKKAKQSAGRDIILALMAAAEKGASGLPLSQRSSRPPATPQAAAS